MKTLTQKHSPTPWKVVREFRCDGDQDYTYYYIRDALGSQIATVDGNCYPSSGEVASERIVRAVNAHQAITDTLNACEVRLSALGLSMTETESWVLASIRVALRAARGES